MREQGEFNWMGDTACLCPQQKGFNGFEEKAVAGSKEGGPFGRRRHPCVQEGEAASKAIVGRGKAELFPLQRPMKG